MQEQGKSRERITFIVFQQELRVRLVNVSRSGCLLQVSRPVRTGAIGRLRVALDDTEYADDVRVARCEPLPGEVCALGIELLWAPKPNEPRDIAPSLAVRLWASDDGSLSAERWPDRT